MEDFASIKNSFFLFYFSPQKPWFFIFTLFFFSFFFWLLLTLIQNTERQMESKAMSFRILSPDCLGFHVGFAFILKNGGIIRFCSLSLQINSGLRCVLTFLENRYSLREFSLGGLNNSMIFVQGLKIQVKPQRLTKLW